MKTYLVSAVIALSVAAPAYAASGTTSSATGSATATIVAPIVLTHTSGAALNFGSFTVGTGGSVVVTSAGAGSVTGDVALVPGSTETADQFTVKGDASRAFSITTGASSVANGNVTMAFTPLASAAAGTTTVAGTAAFTVGGTLTVAGTETPGTYAGTYSATVAYD